MKNSTFIKILRNLTERELKEFDKFINSPYFNTSSAVTVLFKAVKDFYPHYEDNLLEKTRLYSAVHPGKKYNDVLMRKYISLLNKLAEKFLITNNVSFPAHSLAKGLAGKGLYKLFQRHVKKTVKTFPPDLIDEDQFLYLALLKGEVLGTYVHTGMELRYEHEKMEMLELDTFYYLYRIAQMNYRKYSLTADNESNFSDYILKSIDIKKLYETIEGSKTMNKPVLKFLLSLLLLEQSRDEALYHNVKDFTLAYIAKYPGSTTFIGYIYLLDFIVYKIEQGCNEYYRERHLLYKHEEKIRYRGLRENTTIFIIKNYINSALRNDDIEWAEYLIENYVSLFEQKGQLSLEKFFRAFILFHKKKYKEALASIADFNVNSRIPGDVVFTRDMRTLFLQIYFELGYMDEAFSSIDSFYHFLNRSKKVNQKIRTYFGNFVKYYKELITMVSKDNYKGLEKLKKDITGNKAIKKAWLLEKVSELELQSLSAN